MMILLLLEGGLFSFETLPLDGSPLPVQVVLPTVPLPLEGGLIRLFNPAGGLTIPRPLLGAPLSPGAFSIGVFLAPRSLFLT